MGGPAVPQGKIEIAELIDAQRAGGFLFGLAGLCALILAADGFDTQAIGYVAPAVIREWGVEKSALGPVFSAGLFGLLIGSLVAGPLADMIGRRPVLIAATIWFGAGTLLTSLAGSLDEMLWLRFLTGLGLGGALPNCVALVSEYAPKRRRAMLITTMFCGFSIGAALGGVLASEILPQFGWRAVFYVGGTIPLALAPLIFWRLPESLRVLVARGHFERAETVLARMGLPARELALPAEDRGGGLPLKRLFSEGRAAPTLFLWVAFFMNLLSLYFMTNWLPVISHEAGLAVGEAIMVTTMFQAGGTVGGIAIGWLADKIKPQWARHSSLQRWGGVRAIPRLRYIHLEQGSASSAPRSVQMPWRGYSIPHRSVRLELAGRSASGASAPSRDLLSVAFCSRPKCRSVLSFSQARCHPFALPSRLS
jgi:MFS transporter, AAHS family, 4-hydroxybenzoate transporter